MPLIVDWPTRCKSRTTGANMTWRKEDINRLIDLYHQEESLYMPKHPDYNSRTHKKAALKRIAEKLQDIRPNVSVEEVKDKLDNLRSVYNFHRKQVMSKIRNGDIYVPSLWYYSKMDFLHQYLPAKGSDVDTDGEEYGTGAGQIMNETDNNIHNMSVFDSDSCDSDSGRPSTGNHRPKKRKMTKKHERTDLITDDRYAVFGKYLANRLRQIGGLEADRLEDDIILMVIQAERGLRS